MDFDDKRLPSQGEKKNKNRKKEPPAELKKGKPDDYDGDSKKEASRGKRDEETEDEAECAPLTAEISNVLNKKEKAEEETGDKKKKKKKKNKAPGLEGDGKVGKKKKNKKGFDLPGQRRATLNERDPLRIFYETLYKQVPECELAQIRMMESGLLSREEAQKVHKKKQNKTSISPVETIAVESSSLAVERKPSSLGSSRKKEKTETAVTRKKSKKHKDVT